MILRITNASVEDIALNQVVMTISEFADIHNHPWLATQSFDMVIVDLVEGIPQGYLKPLVGKFLTIPVIKGELNPSKIRMLGELYPEESAALMFNFIRDKKALESLLKKMEEKYEWNKYQR